MAKKTMKTTAQAMQERNEQRATEIMTRAAKMVRNAQDLIKTLERLMSEDEGNIQPEVEREVIQANVAPAPELHVVKDARRSTNKTGYEGVFFDNSRTHSYVAEVYIRDRHRRKTGFKTPEEAKVVREQMKRELLKEIEGELGVAAPAHEEKKFQYDQKTLNALGRDAWIAWAKESMTRLAVQQNNENAFPNVVHEMEMQTHSRVKSRLNWMRCHAYFAGKTTAEANRLNEYDVLANDHALRDTFTEIALLKLTGAQRVDEMHTAARNDVEAVSKSKKPVKRKGVQLKEEKGLSKVG